MLMRRLLQRDLSNRMYISLADLVKESSELSLLAWFDMLLNIMHKVNWRFSVH